MEDSAVDPDSLRICYRRMQPSVHLPTSGDPVQGAVGTRSIGVSLSTSAVFPGFHGSSFLPGKSFTSSSCHSSSPMAPSWSHTTQKSTSGPSPRKLSSHRELTLLQRDLLPTRRRSPPQPPHAGTRRGNGSVRSVLSDIRRRILLRLPTIFLRLLRFRSTHPHVVSTTPARRSTRRLYVLCARNLGHVAAFRV
jgi:hypothetical protein